MSRSRRKAHRKKDCGALFLCAAHEILAKKKNSFLHRRLTKFAGGLAYNKDKGGGAIACGVCRRTVAD